MTTAPNGETIMVGQSSDDDGIVLQEFHRLANAQRLYIEQDADYNVTSITDTSGNVVERYEYDPYGNVTVLNPNGTVRGDGLLHSSFYAWNYTFQGGRDDVETEQIEFEHRDDDVPLGRWDQQDPKGTPNGPNRYQFEMSRSPDGVDPTGQILWILNWYTGTATAVPNSQLSIQLPPNHHDWSGIFKDYNPPTNVPYTPPKWEKPVVWSCRVIAFVALAGAAVAGALGAGGAAAAGTDAAATDAAATDAAATDAASTDAASTDAASTDSSAAEGDGTSTCFCAGTLVLTSTGLQPIEQIRIGRRVMTCKDDRSGPSIDADQYRVVTFSCVKDGQEIISSFLRPASVLEGLGAGDTLDVSIMELAVQGKGRVLAVEPCPPLEDGPGTVVTGVFHSRSVDVLKLKLHGLDTPMEATGNHPIFSEDRHDFVMACTLKQGDRLHTRNGFAVIESIEKKYGNWTVYNMEVKGAHQYYVTEKLVLVHNVNGFGDPYENLGNMTTEQLEAEEQKINDLLGEQSDFMDLKEFGYYCERRAQIKLLLKY